MMMRFNSLKILALLSSWLFIQTAALNHELSEEHLHAKTNHLCLIQAAHLDDIIADEQSLEVIALVASYCTPETQSPFSVFNTNFSNHPARAPPTHSFA